MKAAISFSILNFSRAWLAQSMASCCISSFMSACLTTAFLSAILYINIVSNQQCGEACALINIMMLKEDNLLLAKQLQQISVTDPAVIAQCERRNIDIIKMLIDPDLQHFKTRINQIFSDLQTHYQSQRQNLKKCRNVKAQTQNLLNKITECQKHIDEKRQLAEGFKRELQKLEAKTEEAKKSQAQRKQIIVRLRQQKTKKERQAQKEYQKVQNQFEVQIQKLSKHLQQSLKQKTQAFNKCQSLASQQVQAHREQHSLQNSILQLRDKIKKLQTQILELKRSKDQEDRLKIQKQNSMNSLSKSIKDRNQETIKLKKQNWDLIHSGTAISVQITKFKQNKDTKHRERGTKNQYKSKVIKERDNLKENLLKLQEDIKKRQNQLATRQQELRKLQKDLLISQKQREEAIKLQGKRQQAYEDILREKESSAALKKNQIQYQQEQIKLKNQKKKQLQQLKQQLNKANKDFKDKDSKDLQALKAKLQIKNTQKKCVNEVQAYKLENQKLQKMTQQLSKQQQKYGVQASQAHARFYQTVQQVKIKNTQIQRLKKTNQQYQNKLKHQQNLYQSVRSDRNIYSKELNKSKEQTDDLVRKYKRMTHLVQQLREEIKSKDQQLVSADRQLKKIEQENQQIKNQKQRIQSQIQHKQEVVVYYQGQILNLKKLIQDSNAQKTCKQKDYYMIVNQRDILGSFLIKRDQELEALYQKIKLSDSNLAKGGLYLKQKKRELAQLERQLANYKNQLKATQNQINCIDDLKTEISRKQKDLLNQRTKIQALQNQLTKPMNVHRWRKLQATDQENFQRILKIQTLQRRLIAKTQQVQEKQNLIREKQKLFLQLKNILARQHGVKVQEELTANKAALKQKKAQTKKLMEELEDALQQVQLIKNQNQRLKNNLKGLRDQYFKLREEAQKEEQQQLFEQAEAQQQQVLQIGHI